MIAKGRVSVFGGLLVAVSVHAAAVPSEAIDAAAAAGTRRALILCGHPGDEPHREMYARSVERIRGALVGRHGFRPQDVWVRFGAEPRERDGPAVYRARGLATRKGIEADVADLRRRLQPEDSLWVIVLGHAHFDGRHTFLNLPGPDLRDDQFGELFGGMESGRQVFFVTTPVSGFLIKHLSAKGRIVITATEADLEVNETLFHLDLAEVLADPAKIDDFDRDGRTTVLDLYLTVSRQVLLRYKAEENIPTEHAQIDDNGDGQATELQLDYLERELGGRGAGGFTPPIRPTADGALSAQVGIEVAERPDLMLIPGVAPLPGPLPLPTVYPVERHKSES